MRLLTLAVLCALLSGPVLAQTQAPATPPPAPEAQVQAPAALPGDPFGDEVTLPNRQMLALKGTTAWDEAFDTLKEAFKTASAALPKLGLTQVGPPVVVYLRADDAGFDYEAGIPVAPVTGDLPKGDLAVRALPSGRALRFTHRGSYDNMDATYEALTNLLDDRRLEVRDLYVEEYVADPQTTEEEKLHIVVYVFPK